jgi:hypothetical protein
MVPREGNNFYGGGEAHGLDLEFEGKGQGITPNNAMDPRLGNNFLAAVVATLTSSSL